MAPNLLFGCSSFGDSRIPTAEVVQPFLDAWKNLGHTRLDTAYIYPSMDAFTVSEKLLGEVDAAKQGFIIDTKVKSFVPGSHKYDDVIQSGLEQLERLKVDKINILYLHAPDHTVPFEETHKAINELYNKGVFKEFGLSNYKIEEVQLFLDNAKTNGWIKPTVYQGVYNLIARHAEDDLFALLEKNDMAFYGYSPLAGGFFSNFKRDSKPEANGRFDPSTVIGQIFGGFYGKASLWDASDMLAELAQSLGLESNEVALRWLYYSSPLAKNPANGIIIGGSKVEHLKTNLAYIKEGPLTDNAVAAIDKIWEVAKDDALSYCSF
ncbi:NADP-dependent oxidoreductase domain-containing protein [Limtongia smithiae]|uniref:NADP-dependent oxidoreductase domain-containing protein n=1 Tax=Limtongia smithiae TaxID=1125753 RepID=UPI0034CF0371